MRSVHFLVTVDVVTEHPVTVEKLSAVADLDGVATGAAGESYFSATLGAEAKSADEAGSEVSARVRAITPGTVMALQALLTEAFDKRSLVRPNHIDDSGLLKVDLLDAKDGNTY